jgi:hypothetical protein
MLALMVLRSAIGAVLLTFTLQSAAVAQEVDPTPKTVWLEDGTACNLVGGATFVVGDERANYSCDDGRWLIGGVYVRGNGSAEMIAVQWDGNGATLDSIVKLDHWE